MKILLFGATGTAGGSVLQACLNDPSVSEVRVVGRKMPAAKGEKLTFIQHQNFLDFGSIGAAFSALNACFFCLGISVRQVSGEAEYRRITIDIPRAAAAQLRNHSAEAAFHYLSGQGASVKSRFMWARVKAEAEQILLEESGAACWRPGFIDGANSASTPRSYQLLRPVFRQFSWLKSIYLSGDNLGRAMIEATHRGLRGCILENADIRSLANARRNNTAAGGSAGR